MSTSGGSSGGAGVIFAKQTLATPYGDPGVYALGSTDPVDGSWVDFSLDPTNGFLAVGAQTDDTFQASIGGGTGGAQLSTYSDGAEVGSCNLYSNASYSKAQFRAETAQTEPVLDVRDSTGATVFSVLQDGTGLLGAVGQMTDATPLGNPGVIAPGSTVPEDGGWVDFDLGTLIAQLSVGAQADDSYQSYMRGSTSNAQMGVFTDGAGVASFGVTQNNAEVRATLTGETGQTSPLLLAQDSTGADILAVTGDKKIGVFAAPPVVQQTLPAADPVLLSDVITLAQDMRDLLAAYGWATLV